MAHSRAANKELANEIYNLGSNLLSEIETSTPELVSEGLADFSSTGFAFYGSFLNMVINEITTITLPGVSTLNNPMWNFGDAAAATLQGGKQLLDKNTHRPNVTKLKGVTNLSRGVGLAVVTGISTTLGVTAGLALASQGIAGALGIAFLLSCDDVIVAARRRHDLDYWLFDSVEKWDKLNTTVIPHLQNEIQTLENSLWVTRGNTVAIWSLEHKKQRLAQLINEADEIKKDIHARVAVNKNAMEILKKRYPDDSDPKSNRIQTSFMAFTPTYNEGEAEEIEEKALSKCKQEFKKAVELSLFAGITFAGMLLLCFPGGQLAGGILIAISVAMLIKRYGAAVSESAPATKEKLTTFAKGIKTEMKKSNTDPPPKPH